MQNKKTKKEATGFKKFLKNLGPGIITGASDDDPSGIATYTQAGAQFGLATLWTAFLTFPFMIAIQEMCARIGIVTSHGLMTNINKHYPKFVAYFILLLIFPAIILNIGANIAGIGAAANLIVPQIPSYIFSVIFTVLLLVIIVNFSYKKIASILQYLCLSLLLYIVIPFLAKPNWFDVVKNTFIPHIQLNKAYLSILVAILGTTISPYLFFWQATMEAEEIRHKKKPLIVNRRIISDMKVDVRLGMFFSNLVMYFIILTTGTTLYKAGIQKIYSIQQAAEALKPLAGEYSYLLFATGLIGTGLLAIPILSGSLSYMLAATFNWKEGLDKKYYEAKGFYSIVVASLMLGLSIAFININPITALIYSAVLYGLSAPVLILIILFISNNQKIMGKFRNGILSNLFGGLCFLLMFASAILLLYFQFFD